MTVVLGVKLSLRQWSVLASSHNIKVRKLLSPPPPGSLKPYHDKTKTGLRDWSLIMGRGGATKREGGAREVLPLRKGGADKVLAMLKGGHKKFWGRFYVVA